MKVEYKNEEAYCLLTYRRVVDNKEILIYVDGDFPVDAIIEINGYPEDNGKYGQVPSETTFVGRKFDGAYDYFVRLMNKQEAEQMVGYEIEGLNAMSRQMIFDHYGDLSMEKLKLKKGKEFKQARNKRLKAYLTKCIVVPRNL